MKKYLLILFTLFFVTNTIMQAQTALNFKLVNDTGKDIYEVHLTELDSERLKENILPKNVLKAGDSVSIKFSYINNETICEWDLKLTHDKKEEQTWIEVKKIDLCEVNFLIIYIDEDGQYAFKLE
jgi:hypothetical protein